MKNSLHRIPMFGFILMISLSSCIREELPVSAYDRGYAQLYELRMGSDYQQQIWFRLSDGQIAAQNKKVDWDLAFDCREGHFWIFLNTSLIMQAARTGKSDLAQVTSKNGLEFRPDISTGNLDSNAIGKWWEHGEVLVIDRGYTPDGTQIGFVKLRVVGSDPDKYQIEYAALNGQHYHKVDLPRIKNRNRIMLDLDKADVVDIEPENSDWDLLFTTYTHQFYDPFLAYSVTGVLVQEGVQVALENDRPFDDITFGDIDEYQFSSAQDAIGFEWKEYDFDLAQFIIFPQNVYIIKDLKGFYYKLHFTDFYDEAGIKGTPTFIYQKL